LRKPSESSPILRKVLIEEGMFKCSDQMNWTVL